MKGLVPAKGAAGTVHLYPEGEKSPECGTQAPLGPASSHGAKMRHEVDVDDVDPWNLCQKCFPDKHKDYPENDHWFDVEPAWKWDGKLGSDYTYYVECSCGWKHPAGSKSEAYSAGYDHKRYPDKAQDDGTESNDLIDAIERVSEGDHVQVNELEWGEVTNVKDEYDGALADGVMVYLDVVGRKVMLRTFPGKGKANYIDKENEDDGEVQSVDVE